MSLLLKNIRPTLVNDSQDDFSKVVGNSQNSAKYGALMSTINDLEKELEQEKERSNEQKFVFIAILFLFFNVIIIENVTSMGAALILLLPQLVLILIAAYNLGIDVIFAWLEKYVGFKNKDGG